MIFLTLFWQSIFVRNIGFCDGQVLTQQSTAHKSMPQRHAPEPLLRGAHTQRLPRK